MRAVVAVLLCVTAAHAALWGLLRDKQDAPDFKGILPSVSYAPFDGTGHPDVDNIPTAEKIRADLKTLAPLTKAIRLYSSTGGVELVPPIANEFGLKVTVGAWIDKNTERNEREIAAAIDLAKRNSNVIGIVVGNETIYRGEQKAEDLIQLIQRVKKQVNVPVTTGEIWNIWRDDAIEADEKKRPSLASSVDFIAAHVLPYWENFTDKQAVDQAMYIYGLLRDYFPGKRVVIAEFGWPSAGYNLRNAVAGPFEQAVTLRNFVTRAEAIGMEYNIVEAIDQPWKFFEGGVGPYWGILNAAREPKFAWTGPVVNPDYWKLAAIAVLVGILLSLPILRLDRPTALQAAVLSATASGVGAWVATVFAYWNGHYFVFGSALALSLGLVLLVPLIIIAMARIEEIATIAFGHAPRRLIRNGLPAPADGVYPKVSIHIPAYFEPPEMLKQTLDAVARLDYPNFECVVIINNTPDPAFWQPIQDHCRMLGERFVFINAEKVQGFKAGALRIAMARTAPDAEIIGVIDADYVVTPDWLKDLVPAFADPRVGLVQAPQDHRDGGQSLMHYIMNGEYAGFFDIGMVQRNEHDAIIVHGTMCLIRRAAMDMSGGWAGDTICEDTDLGLAVIENGWITHYTNKRYGFGLLPDTYEAFRKQRHRWAYGGFQIVKKHWRRFLPGATRLTRDQKREFSLGWLNWLGAESLGVVVTILNLVWVPIVAFAAIAIPDKILTLPIIVSFLVSALHFLTLYRLRVKVKVGQMLGAMVAAMSVQWTVARAVANGLITEHLPFARTSKGGLSRMSVEFQAFWEAVIGALLWVGAAVLVVTNSQKQITEIYIFAGVLILQSLPFLAAVAIAVLENSRINAFTFWRQTGIRTAELIGLRPVALPLPGAISPPPGSEIRSETP
ncbi:glycosyltransferase [Bradyrhizobium sp. U87765 SZCCT0131]|uniref:glycosyltransferase n=1 Tax=unclassified Bradyrhizobium TaxID=2631580 RepID=UPI001BABF4D8|nr:MULTISPECIES: glycosyltransferase family 2 protein [unclassified Bradyrhizobium]MBR1220150.1 glycosyltransferase [Bradyrhizobium sp. U87765 SZCCT0131]MBR1263394.1 glycosyltransferase [Bradyrhizobium sp. U87765 SZCCT0134]MBR1306723.1 glycosyltransferase [Bradyrhizobium sp. U87765 SZCCT0110]MBR1323222.1 glycosyltransferase [Bradyrhizobium sp. U87765 SZCCT0109]MBR1345677.1 glycosyltransferase [Bradyrhizobium sp. U87765 SZCCT0048]